MFPILWGLEGEVELARIDEARFTLARKIVDDSMSLRDKASVIENTVGIEYVFVLLANGVDDRTIARRLGISSEEFHLFVTASPSLRKRYLEAKAFRVAKKSMVVMDDLAGMSEISREQAAAVKMHAGNIDRLLHTKDEEQHTQGIVVNNTLTISSGREVPKLPIDLEEVFDADFTVREEA